MEDYIDYKDYLTNNTITYNLSDSDIELMKISTLYY